MTPERFCELDNEYRYEFEGKDAEVLKEYVEEFQEEISVLEDKIEYLEEMIRWETEEA